MHTGYTTLAILSGKSAQCAKQSQSWQKFVYMKVLHAYTTLVVLSGISAQRAKQSQSWQKFVYRKVLIKK